MTSLITLHDKLTGLADAIGNQLTPLLARVVFASTLLFYYWNSGLTKLGDGIFGIVSPSIGAYSQIFPKKLEAAGYDVSQFGIFEWAVVMAGTYAEFILPLLIVLGLLTRLAAVGMIGFVVVGGDTSNIEAIKKIKYKSKSKKIAKELIAQLAQ